MNYHNGVIIIMQPGWYTFTANTRGWPAEDYIALHIRVENRAVSYARATGWDTTTVTYTGYFNQFDLGRFSKLYFMYSENLITKTSFSSNV